MNYKNVELKSLLSLNNINEYKFEQDGKDYIYFDDLLLVQKLQAKGLGQLDINKEIKEVQNKRYNRLIKINLLEQRKIELEELALSQIDEKINFFVKMKDKLELKKINVQLKFLNKITDVKIVKEANDLTLIYNGKAEIESFILNDENYNSEQLLNNIIALDNESQEDVNNSYLNHKKEVKEKVSNGLLNNLLYIIIIGYVIVVGILQPAFLSSGSIINIMNQAAFRIPIAVGIAGVIVLTGTDLSAGRIVGLTALITASLLQRSDYPSKMFPGLGNIPILGVLVVVLIVGGVIGIANGFFVAKFKLHPFIVTLATGLIVYAISLKYIGLGTNAGKPIGGLRGDFSNFINGNIFGTSIKMYSLYVVILLVVIWFIWNKTTIGKNMYAVGSNPEAAEVNGISVFKTTIIMFMIAGITYGFNGFITSAYVGSNNASTGQNFELDAIAAAVIGGVSFSGGVGKISGTIIGVILLQLITSSFIFLGIDANLQYAIKGGVILLATAIDMRKYIVKK